MSAPQASFKDANTALVFIRTASAELLSASKQLQSLTLYLLRAKKSMPLDDASKRAEHATKAAELSALLTKIDANIQKDESDVRRLSDADFPQKFRGPVRTHNQIKEFVKEYREAHDMFEVQKDSSRHLLEQVNALMAAQAPSASSGAVPVQPAPSPSTVVVIPATPVSSTHPIGFGGSLPTSLS
jgi:hypothetical protein